MTNTLQSVGVVVGRFQVPALHKGHRYLINTAQASHDNLAVILGSAGFPTPRNPLSFEMRRSLVHMHYPDAKILEIKDQRSNDEWTMSLDSLIGAEFPAHEVVLYGSRDSFIPRYTGRYKTVEVDELKGFSGTVLRAKVAGRKNISSAFRSGVIHAYHTRLAVTRPMVDMAILRGDHVLLGGKPADPAHLWRFPGGLVDQTDASLEAAALRELNEEVSDIEITEFTYVASHQISDWRYLGTGESGLTTLFKANYLSGEAVAGSDLARVAWQPLASLIDTLVEEHRPLGKMLLKSLT